MKLLSYQMWLQKFEEACASYKLAAIVHEQHLTRFQCKVWNIHSITDYHSFLLSLFLRIWKIKTTFRSWWFILACSIMYLFYSKHYLEQELWSIKRRHSENILPFSVVMSNVNNTGLDADWLFIRAILLETKHITSSVHQNHLVQIAKLVT